MKPLIDSLRKQSTRIHQKSLIPEPGSILLKYSNRAEHISNNRGEISLDGSIEEELSYVHIAAETEFASEMLVDDGLVGYVAAETVRTFLFLVASL